MRLESGAHSALEWVSSYRSLAPFISSLDEKTAKEYLETLTGFSEIANRELIGTYPLLRSQTAGGLALAFYPKHGRSYLQSRAFQLPSTPGSLFKIAVAEAALEQSDGLNPLTMVDVWQQNRGRVTTVGKKLSGAFYPRWYRGGTPAKKCNERNGENRPNARACHDKQSLFFAALRRCYPLGPIDSWKRCAFSDLARRRASTFPLNRVDSFLAIFPPTAVVYMPLPLASTRQRQPLFKLPRCYALWSVTSPSNHPSLDIPMR